MKLLSWLPFLVGAVLAPQAVQASSALEALAAAMPACGLQCLEKAVLASPCSLTNTTCSCSNSTITDQVELCVYAACTIKEQLTTKNLTQTMCNAPVRDRTKAVSIAGVTGAVIASISYVMRMVAKLPAFGGKFGWDDVFITASMLVMWPLSILSVRLSNLGLGRDIWTVPFKNITEILHIYYFDAMLYIATLPLVKISIIFFYLRIIPEKGFRLSCWITMALCGGYLIAFVLATVFQCWPIHYDWQRWDGEHQGRCNNLNSMGWSSAAVNVVLDLAILILPLPHLAKLQLNTRKKIFVMMMFSVGIFVTIVSILRLQALISYGSSTNFTWTYTTVGYWSTIEMHTAILCANMPACRALIKHFSPRLMGQTTAGKSLNKSNNSKLSSMGSSGNHLSSKNRVKNGDEMEFIPLKDMESQVEVRSVGH